MVSCNISNIVAETLVALAHFIFTGGWWCFGHFTFLLFVGCDKYNDGGFSECAGSDPIGFGFLIGSSILFFYIARHVLNFLYKGELPGGEQLAKRFSQVVGQTNLGKKDKKKR